MSKDKAPIIFSLVIGFLLIMFGSILLMIGSLVEKSIILYIGLSIIGVAIILYIVLIIIGVVYFVKKKKKE